MLLVRCVSNLRREVAIQDRQMSDLARRSEPLSRDLLCNQPQRSLRFEACSYEKSNSLSIWRQVERLNAGACNDAAQRGFVDSGCRRIRGVCLRPDKTWLKHGERHRET